MFLSVLASWHRIMSYCRIASWPHGGIMASTAGRIYIKYIIYSIYIVISKYAYVDMLMYM